MLARERCGLGAAAHAEYGPGGEPVIVPLECSLVGHEGAIHSAPGSRFRSIMGVERSLERYHCSYGIDPATSTGSPRRGVVFGAHDDAGDVRALELPGHPFFLGTLFQPELAEGPARTRWSARSRPPARRASPRVSPRRVGPLERALGMTPVRGAPSTRRGRGGAGARRACNGAAVDGGHVAEPPRGTRLADGGVEPARSSPPPRRPPGR